MCLFEFDVFHHLDKPRTLSGFKFVHRCCYEVCVNIVVSNSFVIVLLPSCANIFLFSFPLKFLVLCWLFVLFGISKFDLVRTVSRLADISRTSWSCPTAYSSSWRACQLRKSSWSTQQKVSPTLCYKRLPAPVVSQTTNLGPGWHACWCLSRHSLEYTCNIQNT